MDSSFPNLTDTLRSVCQQATAETGFFRIIPWTRQTAADLVSAAAADQPLAFGESLLLNCEWLQAVPGPTVTGNSGNGDSDKKAARPPRAAGHLGQELAAAKTFSRLVQSIARQPTLTRTPDVICEVLLKFDRQPLLLTDLQRAGLWKGLLVSTLRLLDESARIGEETGATPHERLMSRGILPWLAGWCFADVAGLLPFHKAGQQFLQSELLTLTDRDGLPDGRLLDELPDWVHSLELAEAFADRHGLKLWNARTQSRMTRLRNQLPRFFPTADLSGTAGRQNTTAARNGATGSSSRNGVVPSRSSRTANRGDSRVQSPANTAGHARSNGHSSNAVTGRGNGRARTQDAVTNDAATDRSKVAGHEALAVSAHTETGKVACLRNQWQGTADSLTVNYSRPEISLRLEGLGIPLLAGGWEIDLRRDGERLDPVSRWACTCWNSDEDGDFLELQADRDGIRFERQLYLARHENLAVLADCISSPVSSRLEYAARLRLAERVAVHHVSRTAECRLKGKGIAARVFPLVCDQDRPTTAGGALEADAGGVSFRVQTTGRGLYVPVVIDWNPARRTAAADWRRLTVSEEGRVVPADRAGAYRLRVGPDQWLLYRSLVHSLEARAVLGYHTRYESAIARFDGQGKATPLISIEPPAIMG